MTKLTYDVGGDEEGNWVLTKPQPRTSDTKPLVPQNEQEQKIVDAVEQITRPDPVEFDFAQRFRRGVLFLTFCIGGVYAASALGVIHESIKGPPLMLGLLILFAAIALYLLEPKRFRRNGEAFRRNFTDLNMQYEQKIDRLRNWRQR